MRDQTGHKITDRTHGATFYATKKWTANMQKVDRIPARGSLHRLIRQTAESLAEKAPLNVIYGVECADVECFYFNKSSTRPSSIIAVAIGTSVFGAAFSPTKPSNCLTVEITLSR